MGSSSNNTGTIAGRFVEQIAATIEDRFGYVHPDVRAYPDRVSLTRYYDLLETAQEHASTWIGFELARVLKVAAFEELGYLIRSSKTLGAAMREGTELIRAFTDEPVTFECAGPHASLSYKPVGATRPAHRIAAEFMLADSLEGFVLCGASDEAQARLELCGEPPATDLARYREVAGVPIGFGAKVDRLIFSRSILECPMPDADSDLAELMRKRVRAQLGLGERCMDPFVTKVLGVMRKETHAGCLPTVGAVAEQLEISSRTVHRMLRERGHRFFDLADDVRAQRDDQLRAEGVAIATIAQCLGFSSPKAYHRARKRWRTDTM